MTNVHVITEGGTKNQREFATELTCWYINKELPRYKNLSVEIDLVKLDTHGYIDKVDNRQFQIEINKKLKGDDFITCIFHELTHMEQFLRNRLGINEDNDNIHYLDRAYEIDAYEKQEELLEEWKNETSK
tara:strand:- start:1019 stop:1408 length:390 start_codon:yes stop_codon:yes gene_type:complete